MNNLLAKACSSTLWQVDFINRNIIMHRINNISHYKWLSLNGFSCEQYTLVNSSTISILVVTFAATKANCLRKKGIKLEPPLKIKLFCSIPLQLFRRIEWETVHTRAIYIINAHTKLSFVGLCTRIFMLVLLIRFNAISW